MQRITALPFPSLTCVDVGVRDGVSSTLMLLASAHHSDSQVIGIDASEIPPMLKRNPRYRAMEHIDSATALSKLKEPVHCAFVDSLHIAHQVATEVRFLWELMPVGSLLALHDAAWPEGKCDHYLDRDWPTVDVAIHWLFWNRPYAETEVFTESWGMAFIRKLTDAPLELTGITWAEIWAGRNELLAILPSGVRKREITV